MQLVDKMALCLIPYNHLDATMGEALSVGAQPDTLNHLNHILNAQQDTEKIDSLPFQEDTVPLTGPPLVRVLLWRG